MNYDEVTIKGKEELREKIQELYGLDIADAICSFSTRNFSFIFSEGCRPVVLRVSIDPLRTREDVLSELMWVDDLREQIPNIAQMIPNSAGHIAEEFDISGQHIMVCQFRKLSGAFPTPDVRDEAFFREVGTLLGRIHRVSCEEQSSGFKFKRKRWTEMPGFNPQILAEAIDDKAAAKMTELINELGQIPEDFQSFGMIHSDFVVQNIFVDWDVVSLFDFDDCCYGYYLYDIAEIMLSCMSPDYKPMMNRLEMYDWILGILREAYEKEHHLPDDQWARIPRVMALRAGQICVHLVLQKDAFPPDKWPQFFQHMSSTFAGADDFLVHYEQGMAPIRQYMMAQMQSRSNS